LALLAGQVDLAVVRPLVAGPAVIPGLGAGAVRRGGNWVCAWSTDPLAIGGDRLTLRFFDSEANALTAEIQPNVGHVTGVNGITLLDSGQFVVTSVSHIQPSDLGKDQSTVVANVFKPDGTKTVHFTAGDPRHFTRYDPAVAHLPSGRFLLAWVEESADTHQTVPTAMARLLRARELARREGPGQYGDHRCAVPDVRHDGFRQRAGGRAHRLGRRQPSRRRPERRCPGPRSPSRPAEHWSSCSVHGGRGRRSPTCDLGKG
jgi:hypothetical protein